MLENLQRETLGQVCRKGMDICPEHPVLMQYATLFSDEIMIAPFYKNFKILNLVVYDGKGDTKAHVDVFNAWMDFEGVFEVAQCKAFLLTLTKTTQAWLARLQPRSIMLFEQ